MDIPFIEQVKIQARLLVPILKALQAELGKEHADEIVRKALEEQMLKMGREMRELSKGSSIEKIVASTPFFTAGGALDIKIIEHTPETLKSNVTRCLYAQFYKEIGEPELGSLLVCSQDFPLYKGLAPDVEFTRTQTIMEGADHCDFRFQAK